MAGKASQHPVDVPVIGQVMKATLEGTPQSKESHSSQPSGSSTVFFDT
jgi:hypothetical protein